jgi:hypothetical protein
VETITSACADLFTRAQPLDPRAGEPSGSLMASHRDTSNAPKDLALALATVLSQGRWRAGARRNVRKLWVR